MWTGDPVPIDEIANCLRPRIDGVTWAEQFAFQVEGLFGDFDRGQLTEESREYVFVTRLG